MSTTTATQFEAAMADIQLFGTPRQVELAQDFAVGFAADGAAALDPLLEDLRADLRAELDLLEVPARIKYLRITFDHDNAVVQFREAIDRRLSDLAVSVASVENRPAGESLGQFKSDISLEQYSEEYTNILSSSASSHEKVLLVTRLIEQAVREFAEATDVEDAQSRRYTLGELVATLASRGVIPSDEQALFAELIDIRNRLVHGYRSDLSNAEAARFFDLAWRLIRILGRGNA